MIDWKNIDKHVRKEQLLILNKLKSKCTLLNYYDSRMNECFGIVNMKDHVRFNYVSYHFTLYIITHTTFQKILFTHQFLQVSDLVKL